MEDLVARNQQICVNIGVLGHVDCGKTSLCKVLSTTASTAAFDSNPQSKERGITLDLGFSAFPLDNKYNVTLVDCPGHASLIRTVLGGVRIMDLMILVVDVIKGMQPQTWECLVLASITCRSLIVALNKVDLLPKETREAKVEKIKGLVITTLKKAEFEPQPVVVVSALDSEIGVGALKEAILEKLNKTGIKRDTTSSLVMAVDHCFNIKGSGAVCTGTLLQGHVKVNDNVEFPELQTTKKVKTMQIFKQAVQIARAGDRVALGIPGLDAKTVERGIICAPGLIPLASRTVIARVHKISFFKDTVLSGKRYHVSMGYSTITATVYFFSPDVASVQSKDEDEVFSRDKHYILQNTLELDRSHERAKKVNFALLDLDKATYTLPHTLLIAANLQTADDALPCRLAFHGSMVESCEDKDYKDTYLPSLNIYWYKTKTGTVNRVHSSDALIVTGFCQKGSNINHILGLKVNVRGGDNAGGGGGDGFETSGRIESRFGQTNKVRVSLDKPLSDGEMSYVQSHPCTVNLTYKKYKFKSKSETDGKLYQ